ncbi:MAG: glycosyltransferase family 2 protein [Deltaproteobacteria bacterium]|nr:glycosyltransferase family 2 protein [Deltaproteobacteria bacterium]MBI3295644.1 glycosyltransferase family 2 protein [Deltaproteobacteria bacterium]
MKSRDQYLALYAEPESRNVPLPLKFDRAVTIPSLGEDLDRVLSSLRFAAHHSALRPLFIIVVNNRTDHSASLIAANRHLLDSVLPTAEPLTTGLYWVAPDRLIVDRSTLPFPPKQGVGLARKIGCDIALRLIAQGSVLSRWIHCTDGDCEVPEDYFTIAPPDGTAACVYNFEHVLDWSRPYEAEALQLYDQSLRCYVEGLKHAGSPYAHQSLGSTLALHSDSYAMVRGFPKTAAAEDFYLLNKLAKVGRIETLTQPTIRIHQRISDRVPFGTGVSTRKISEDLEAGRNYQVYHPAIFDHLATFLKGTDCLSRQPPSPEQLDTLWKEGPEGAEEAWEIAQRTRTTPEQRRKHFHDWFDAFRTLKYVHHLRDHRYGVAPIATSVTKLSDRLPGSQPLPLQ